jgi:hypothetical protein
MRTRVTIISTAILIVFVDLAAAHNLFIHVEKQLDGPDLIDVFFEHAPYPGKGEYNGPILERGQTWVRTPDAEQPIPHQVAEITRRGKVFLQGETRTQSPRAIEHSCKWGIYHGRLDYFYGKYLDVQTAQQVKRLGRASRLPLDLVPQPETDTFRVRVLWRGEPRGDLTVYVWPPGGGEQKLRTDAEGIVTLPDAKPGLYAFATVLTLEDEKGEFDGQAYDGVMHGVTLTMPWPLK